MTLNFGEMLKKLGSLLGDKEDINRRKQISIISMNKYETLWIKKEHLNEHLPIELHKKLIKPNLLYRVFPTVGGWGEVPPH